jgi:hypothetical protein
MTQPPLFEYVGPPVPRPSRRPPPAQGQVRWTRVTAQGTPCDDCMALHVERADAPLARRARFRRAQGDTDRLLCGEHAEDWRQADGRKALPKEPHHHGEKR